MLSQAEYKVEYHGVLEGYWETGTEGVQWVLLEDGYSGYEAFREIEAGDHLTVYDDHDVVLFADTIKQDRKTGWRPYPLNPSCGQQCALGFWIHWIQQGWDPDAWAYLFLRDQLKPEDGGGPALRGILRKKKRKQKIKS